MKVQRFLLLADHVSTWCGKASAWLIILLMAAVCVEVFKRYLLNAPTAWSFDADYMIYGTLFMMCGAYTLAQDAHVRGDFLYSSMKPRVQAGRYQSPLRWDSWESPGTTPGILARGRPQSLRGQ